MLANPETDDGNYHAVRGPAPHFLDSVDRAAGEASLSLEKDATLVPEVSYFTVPFPASSHRL